MMGHQFTFAKVPMVHEVAMHCNVRVLELHACAFGDDTYLDPFSLLPVHLEGLTLEVDALDGRG
eukprot:8177577-Pyramimonas_sp.AAC.1